MGNRFSSVSFRGVAVTTALDMFEITVPSNGKPVTIAELVVSQRTDYGDAAAEGLGIVIKRGIGNTVGSGGSAATPAKHKSNDAAPSFTAKINNTTLAVAGAGSLQEIRPEEFSVQAGYQYLPLERQRITFYPGENAIISTTAPADELTMSAVLVLEEDQ